jgi:hypothetical protein
MENGEEMPLGNIWIPKVKFTQLQKKFVNTAQLALELQGWPGCWKQKSNYMYMNLFSIFQLLYCHITMYLNSSETI